MGDLQEYLPWLRGIALSLFKEFGLSQQGFEVDELVNAGYEALCRAAGRYRKGDKAGLTTYAFDGVRGEMLNTLKRIKGKEKLLDEQESQDRVEFGSARRDPAPQMIERLIAIEEMEGVKDCLEQLPADLQMVWRLRAAGMTHEKIGGILNMNTTKAWRLEGLMIELMKSCLKNKGLL